jgi:hypothetical protein
LITATTKATSASTTTPTSPAANSQGAPCSSEGTMICDGTSSFATCSNGSWVVQSCGSGLECYDNGGSLYCGWPVSS